MSRWSMGTLMPLSQRRLPTSTSPHETSSSNLHRFAILISILECHNHTAHSLSVNYSSLPFVASGDVNFQFWDYFQLIGWCIAHMCSWHSHTMNPALIICPKSEWGLVDTRAVGTMPHNQAKATTACTSKLLTSLPYWHNRSGHHPSVCPFLLQL